MSLDNLLLFIAYCLMLEKPITAKRLLWSIDKQPKWTQEGMTRFCKKEYNLRRELSWRSTDETAGGDCFLANRKPASAEA